MGFSVFTVDQTGGLSLIHNGQTHSVASDHPKFSQILDLVRLGDFDNALSLIDVRKSVIDWIANHPRVELRNDRLHLDGESFSDIITEKALNMIERGNSAQPLVNFLTNVRDNPSSVAQNELLLFCEANNFMIDEDGFIVAYKSVRGNYTDIHSGKYDNSVGAQNKMKRRDVDDRRNVTCSHGLHFASYQYASTWAGRIDGVHRRLMVIRVNPRDVVSIPDDYSNQKGRCCQYDVVAELTENRPLPPKEVYSRDEYMDPWNDDPNVVDWDEDTLDYMGEYEILDTFSHGVHDVTDEEFINADYIVVDQDLSEVKYFVGPWAEGAARHEADIREMERIHFSQ